MNIDTQDILEDQILVQFWECGDEEDENPGAPHWEVRVKPQVSTFYMNNGTFGVSHEDITVAAKGWALVLLKGVLFYVESDGTLVDGENGGSFEYDLSMRPASRELIEGKISEIIFCSNNFDQLPLSEMGFDQDVLNENVRALQTALKHLNQQA